VKYYSDQTSTALPIKCSATSSPPPCPSAVFAAMNTMYASVGSRTREIGTLRVLGSAPHDSGRLHHRRRAAGAIGGVLGCLLALPMHGFPRAR